MLVFLALAVLGTNLAHPAPDRAEERCRAAVATKGYGDVADFAVESVDRIGRTTRLRGTVHVLQRPATRPGEMSPTHVVNAPFSFDCRIDGRRAPRVTLKPLAD